MERAMTSHEEEIDETQKLSSTNNTSTQRTQEEDEDPISSSSLPPPPPPSSSNIHKNNNNNNNTNNTSPHVLFTLFILLNFITLADRGIIPGASREFAAFFVSAPDSPVKSNPDIGLGFMQASFVGGYSIAVILSGHYVHRISWKYLIMGSMSVWFLAVLGSGFSYSINSFYFLLFSRILSGVSEAAFHVIAPPLIQDRGGSNAGLWLSAYLMAIPVGLAVGYVYGSLLANHSSLGWEWAFYFEAIAALGFIGATFFIHDDINNGILTNAPSSSSSSPSPPATTSTSSSTTTEQEDLTLWKGIHVCITNRVLLFITLANASLIAVVASLGTFGGAFILALQLFDSEEVAAMAFASAAAIAGIVGTPLGGLLVDRILSQHGGAGPNGGDGEEDYRTSSEILTSLLPSINITIILGTLFAWPTCIIQHPAPFLFFLLAAWTCMFASQSGTTMAIMISVQNHNKAYRSNAIGFATLMTHLLGDVPFPILLGMIKDKLAPGCNVTMEGDFENESLCLQQRNGIRFTLAIAYAWMTTSTVFFELARCVASKQAKEDRKERCAELIQRLELGEDDGNSSGNAAGGVMDSMIVPSSSSVANANYHHHHHEEEEVNYRREQELL